MTRGEPDSPARDVVVAIPARDEEADVADCLRAVVAATTAAVDARIVGRVRVVVAAHRCTDETAARARATLTDAATDHLVLELPDPAPVGRIRTEAVRRALEAPLRFDPERTWVLSTDADSRVPTDWVTGLLAAADRTGADLIAGLTTLADWDADPAARAAYDRLLDAGMGRDGHRHVYAANLAVSCGAFLRAGGFPAVAHGEEHGLVAGVRRTGGVVTSAYAPVVETSARMPGRAELGLGALLLRLRDG